VGFVEGVGHARGWVFLGFGAWHWMQIFGSAWAWVAGGFGSFRLRNLEDEAGDNSNCKQTTRNCRAVFHLVI